MQISQRQAESLHKNTTGHHAPGVSMMGSSGEKQIDWKQLSEMNWIVKWNFGRGAVVQDLPSGIVFTFSFYIITRGKEEKQMMRLIKLFIYWSELKHAFKKMFVVS